MGPNPNSLDAVSEGECDVVNVNIENCCLDESRVCTLLQKVERVIIDKSSVSNCVVLKNSSCVESTLVQCTFGNDLVIEEILSKLSTSNLKICRGVNSRWNFYAIRILLQREAFQLQFAFPYLKKVFELKHSSDQEKEKEPTDPNSPKPDSKYNIPAFCSLLNNTKNWTFQCNKFSFLRGSLLVPELQKFLTHHGYIVKHLQLDIDTRSRECYWNGTVTVTVENGYKDQFKYINYFKALLTYQLPNLEKLELGQFPTLWNDINDLTQLFPEPIILDTTTVLSKLKFLKFCDDPPKKICIDFLRICSKTLEVFYSQPLGDYDIVEIPVMYRLKTLRMLTYSWNTGRKKLFPKDLKLSDKFPGLKIFESDIIYSKLFDPQNLDWNTFFGASKHDSFPSVTNLKFASGTPQKWIQNLAKIFPNASSFKVDLVNDLAEFGQICWKMSKLEVLEFMVDINEDNHQYPTIDSVLTGFSIETCLDLYSSSRNPQVTVSRTRANSSLLDLKHLRKLHMTICDSQGTSRSDLTVPFISHVAGLFAFQLCPKLHLSIGVCAENIDNTDSLKNGLSPILPYVHSVNHKKKPRHWY